MGQELAGHILPEEEREGFRAEVARDAKPVGEKHELHRAESRRLRPSSPGYHRHRDVEGYQVLVL